MSSSNFLKFAAPILALCFLTEACLAQDDSRAEKQLYPDVAANDPDFASIKACSRAGIMTDISDGKFFPDDPITRYHWTVTLARLAGELQVPMGVMPALPKDVSRSHWAAPGVTWAYAVLQETPPDPFHGSALVTQKDVWAQFEKFRLRARRAVVEHPALPQDSKPVPRRLVSRIVSALLKAPVLSTPAAPKEQASHSKLSSAWPSICAIGFLVVIIIVVKRKLDTVT